MDGAQMIRRRKGKNRHGTCQKAEPEIEISTGDASRRSGADIQRTCSYWNIAHHSLGLRLDK